MDIYVQKYGEKLGPLSENQVRLRTQTGIIAPEDLASTSGGAPWQPLSTLINLETVASPLPATVTNLMVELNPVGSGHMSESILYRDTDEFLTSRPFEDHMIPHVPRVTVERERLKVGDDTYLLEGITGITLDSPLERISAATFVKKLALWVWFWLSLVLVGCFCYLERGKQGNWSETFLCFVFCGVPYVLAKLANRKDIKQRYHHAVVSLMRAGQPTKIFIGAFRQAPGWISDERDLWKDGTIEGDREKAYERRKVYFERSVTRIQQIAEAIGQAIKGKPAALNGNSVVS